MDQHALVEQLRALVGAYEAERLGHNGLAQLCIGHDGTVRVTVWSPTNATLIFGGDTPDEALVKARDGFARDSATVADVAAPTDKPRWTPGPWQVEHGPLGAYTVAPISDGGQFYICRQPGSIDRREMNKATGTLIASSPELYEALLAMDGLVNMCQAICEHALMPDGLSDKDAMAMLIATLDGPDQRAAQGAARAALAKARGE